MLHIDTLVEAIQYEESLCALSPLLCRKLENMESDQLVIRFLRKMGDDFSLVLSNMLEGLSESSKDELFCGLTQFYGPKMTQELNGALAENRLGQHFRIGGISAEQVDGRICLALSSVAVDYSGLLQNQEVQEALSGKLHGRLNRFLGTDLAGRIVHQGMNHTAFLIEALLNGGEQALLPILEQSSVKKALLRLVEDTLQKNGLHLQLMDLQIRPDRRPEERSAPLCETAKFQLSYELEEALLDSAAAFLRKASAWMK